MAEATNPSPSLPALLTDDEIFDMVGEVGLDWHRGFTLADTVNRYETLARAVEAAVLARSSPAPSAPTIDAPGLVFMIAYGDKTAVRGMFDTSEQAHAFVKRFKEFVPRSDITTLGGGAPGDHNGVKAAAEPTAPVVPLPLTDAQMLLAWMDETFGNDDGLDWHDEDAASVADALNKAVENFKLMRGAATPTAAPADSAEMVVLRDLVACKDIQDQADAIEFAGPASTFGDNWKAEYDRLRREYIRRKAGLWDRARALVAQKEKQG